MKITLVRAWDAVKGKRLSPLWSVEVQHRITIRPRFQVFVLASKFRPFVHFSSVGAGADVQLLIPRQVTTIEPM